LSMDLSIQEAIDELVAAAPPLSKETKAKLAVLLSDLPYDGQ